MLSDLSKSFSSKNHCALFISVVCTVSPYYWARKVQQMWENNTSKYQLDLICYLKLFKAIETNVLYQNVRKHKK